MPLDRGPEVVVRPMEEPDLASWAKMRTALWPSDGPDAHLSEITDLLRSGTGWCFAVEAFDRTLLGFAEVSLRPFANGCTSRPVPVLEGIWIVPTARRAGVAGRLLAFIESVLAGEGFEELGSDAELENTGSHAAHCAWGFKEAERVVCFRKAIGPAYRAHVAFDDADP